ncbi:TetR/AcrR family transcriptional regulator [Saccharopolyspora sp. ASAGF58]|nr:TetR/AcrR family transcriptional regulator [Saccharopolyspora sp. ASAGF58]
MPPKVWCCAMVSTESPVERIARRAGIGKGAIYREFGSKHELMDALLARCTRRLVDQVRQGVLAASTPVGLSAVYRFGIEALLDDSLLTAAFLDVPVVAAPVRWGARTGIIASRPISRMRTIPAMPARWVPNRAMKPLKASGPRKLTARPVVA